MAKSYDDFILMGNYLPFWMLLQSRMNRLSSTGDKCFGGLILVAGEIADGQNAAIYYARGDKVNVTLS